ncbi:hypothetical protein THAOC_06130 [Thalassiosira oceanica]|uniref:Uncharacterized protein n=1 Tax=Thalassiosira oceanica TaxID=159749 RepID=K0T142_THAOC|nr:hypothetical protein THAOC_06130 [Thalassiosira oceanica]|eukprot:EJK72348.1 hypothetical protein THAOC_06130 [Thalassiosira oceanica]
MAVMLFHASRLASSRPSPSQGKARREEPLFHASRLASSSAFDYCSPFSFRRFMYFFGAEGKRTVAYTQLGQISTLFGYLLSALEILDMLWRFWTLSFGDLGHALEILDFIMNGPNHDSPCFRIDGSHAFTSLILGLIGAM